MTPTLRLALVVHNHQPIGNFDHVAERAYADAYLPLLQTFARFPTLKLALHLSGSLFDWLEERHPGYLDEVGRLVRLGRVQLLGGAYYEPILPMIPRRDRLAQIRNYGAKLAERFGTVPRGMWLAERVWEQQLAGDLSAAGIEHTIVDDVHFRRAGLKPEQLFGYYLTEDDGRLLAVLPGNERLRYLLPFAPPEEAIEYLRGVAAEHPGATVVFADDGEKFGAWPGTRELCREQGWLTRFFELLAANPWIETTVPADVVRRSPPLGKIYLPDGSYPEMHQWASLGDEAASGGTWRNFLVKYPEAGAMYARMLMVADRVARAEQLGYPADVVAAARCELHKAQCNCAYWHGSFGGVYLSHLRQAVYRHLIRADNLLDRTADRPEHWVEAAVRDHNLDTRREVCLASDRLIAFVAPHDGGRLYELDVRAAARNVLATVARRDEPYHAEGGPAADVRPRHGLIEHFYRAPPALDDVAEGRAADVGDFADAAYAFQVEQRADVASVRMTRVGRVDEAAVRLTKTVSLAAGGEALVCDYRLENLPLDRTLHFAVEFNFAGFDDGERRVLQQSDVQRIDPAAGLSIGLGATRPASWYAYPVRVVNRWEGGLETTHQAACLMPCWDVRGDAAGTWGVTLSLPVRTLPLAALGPRDLGDAEPEIQSPRIKIVTHTETVRGKPEVQRRTTRRLKAAG